MILTISGKWWSWKSTCAKLLCQKLWYDRVYGGQVFRDNAKEMWMDLFSYLQYLNDRPTLEKEIDLELMRRCEANENVIWESRVGKVLYPDHIWIFLDVSIEEWTRRIMWDLEINQEARNETWFDSLDEAKQSYINRIDEDRQRYLALYGKNIYDLNLYDIVIDTTDIPVEEVVQSILDRLKTND